MRRNGSWMLGLVMGAVLGPPVAFAQTTTGAQASNMPQTSTSPPALRIRSEQNQLLGGVPEGKPTPGVMPLSLTDAIHMGLSHNLGMLLQGQSVRAARG